MLSLIGFIVILGPLVIVHEFGHYIFARMFNVKAEIFSIGFGPKLWARQMGETELRVSAVPLGGYVKLLGEDRETELSEAELQRALHKQAPWKRFFIFAGGPLFNFLFAILVFMVILVVGEPKVANVIGRVVHQSAAEKAGFQSGDRILSVDGKAVKSYEEVLMAVLDNPKKTMAFSVVHRSSSSGQPVTIEVVPQPEKGYSVYGESTHIGQIDGMEMVARGMMVGISDPNSLAAKAGFVTGDLIEKVNGTAFTNWEDYEVFLNGIAIGTDVRFDVANEKAKTKKEIVLKKGQDWGLWSSELFVEKPVDKSPAEVAGVKSGDRLLGVGEKAVNSFFQLRDAIQAAGEKDGKVVLHWERDGKKQSSAITPTATHGKDPALKKTTQFTVGVIPMLMFAEPETFIERVFNPFVLLYRGTEKMVVFTWRNVVAIRKMLTGDVSVATLGGPIMIGKIAGESISRGLAAFLSTMAVLSIGLGVLNILPVPVLDGGHLLLLGIEIVRGKPLTMRMMEIIQLVGLSLILLLMAVVIKNDLARVIF